MAGSKIFAGARLRRIRNKQNQSQAAFAESLGISASYLNLIERDQRPLTAQVLLRLHTQHEVDIAELGASAEQGTSLAQLKEVIADPLLMGEIPATSELVEAAQVAPNLVGATVKLYQAYREVLKRLGDLNQEIAVTGAVTKQLPFEAVRRWIEASGSLFPSLEALAEEIWFELSPKDDVLAGLKARLRANSGIDMRIVPIDIMGPDRARYDRHSQRLFVSETLNAQDRVLEAALLVSRLEGTSAIDEVLAKTAFAGHPESNRLARQHLVRLLATAILCPAAKFSAAMQDLSFDVKALQSRFNVGVRTAMQRMACLSLREDSEVALGFLAIDASGAVVERVGELGFYLPTSGALCGQLPMFDLENEPRVASMQSADGKILILITLRDGAVTCALCVQPQPASKTVYGRLAEAQVPRPLGPTCRLCEIRNCTRRREPPSTRPAVMNEFVRGATDYEPM